MPIPGPFDCIFCVRERERERKEGRKKESAPVTPLFLCVSPSSLGCDTPESTTTLGAPLIVSCYSHSSRVTRVGGKIHVLGTCHHLLQTQRPSILKLHPRKTKANKVLPSWRVVVTKTKYLYDMLAVDKYYRLIKQEGGETAMIGLQGSWSDGE